MKTRQQKIEKITELAYGWVKENGDIPAKELNNEAKVAEVKEKLSLVAGIAVDIFDTLITPTTIDPPPEG